MQIYKEIELSQRGTKPLMCDMFSSKSLQTIMPGVSDVAFFQSNFRKEACVLCFLKQNGNRMSFYYCLYMYVLYITLPVVDCCWNPTGQLVVYIIYYSNCNRIGIFREQGERG